VDNLMLALPAAVINNPGTVTHVLMNWGVNDMNSWPIAEATWETQYESIITYSHGRFPNAKVVLSYPWRVGFDTQAATMHGWVDTVIAWCGSQGIVCMAGVDEAVTIKAGDDGHAETDFVTGGAGVHYSDPLGVGLYATAMQHILGW